MSNTQPGFSICIPNFNYATYLRLTLESVLNQSYTNFEICVADNNSTDQSLAVARSFQDDKVRLKVNPVNLGFAANLDVVSAMALKEYNILLSSDDVMNAGALDVYARFIHQVKDQRMAFCSACNRIDSNGVVIGYDGPRSKVWFQQDIDAELSSQVGHPVYKVAAAVMLSRCLKSFYGYFNFASACYRQEHLLAVGGYGGSRLMNPDKWFHWRLLGVVDWVYFIDHPFFSYRWHNQNQSALQEGSGALKFFLDEYRSSFEIDATLAAKANLTLGEIKSSFVTNIITKYIFRYLWQGNRQQAMRIYHFGWSTYPTLLRNNWIVRSLRMMLFFGPAGTFLTRIIKSKF